MKNFNKTIFVKNENYKQGTQLKFKTHILFYENNSWIVALGQIKFTAVRDYEHTYKFYLNHYFAWRSS
jgi:hypothetical protein